MEKSPANFPTKYIAKQVLVSENTATVLEKALESPSNPSSNVPKKPEEKGLGTDWNVLFWRFFVFLCIHLNLNNFYMNNTEFIHPCYIFEKINNNVVHSL